MVITAHCIVLVFFFFFFSCNKLQTHLQMHMLGWSNNGNELVAADCLYSILFVPLKISNRTEIKWREKKERKDAVAKKIKLNLKCSEEDKQVGQSREEEK